MAISDPLPAYRLGLTSALVEAGFVVEDPEDLLAWAADPGLRVILISIALSEDEALAVRLRRRAPELVLVALVDETTAKSYAEALQMGATGAVGRDDEPEAVVKVVKAALENQTLLPTEVARALAAASPLNSKASGLSEREVAWLRMLAKGISVGKLAEQHSYSEREMSRLLRNLYRRMGAENRVEAIVKAARWGLLDQEP